MAEVPPLARFESKLRQIGREQMPKPAQLRFLSPTHQKMLHRERRRLLKLLAISTNANDLLRFNEQLQRRLASIMLRFSLLPRSGE